MSYTKKKMAMKIDKKSLAYSFFSQMNTNSGDHKNIDLVNETKPISWVDELINYWEKIIEQTSTSMELIKCDRVRMDLPFDEKFKDDFMHAANTIIGCTVEHFLMSKPFNHTNLAATHTSQQYQGNGTNTKNGVGHGNQTDDKLVHHESQYAVSTDSPERKKVKLETTDPQLPQIKTEMNILDESVNITAHKTKRVRKAAANIKPILKNLNANTSCNSSHIVPIMRKKTNKDDKTGAYTTQHPTVQQRKRKNMNTTITGNLKKKRKLNDNTVGTAKPFKCDFCEYSTKTNRTLSRHMRVHIGERLFQCKFCCIQFTQKGNLNAHMKKHSDLFAYQCSNCRLGFTQKEPWQLHESCCTAKQYECHLCTKKFYQRKSDLIRHMRIWHTDDRPFICLDCPQRYHLKHELLRHIKCHHKE